MTRSVYKLFLGLLLAVFFVPVFASDSAGHSMDMCLAATPSSTGWTCSDIGQISATKGMVAQIDTAGNAHNYAAYPYVAPPPVACNAGDGFQTFQIMGDAPPSGSCGGCNCSLLNYSNCSATGGGVTCIANYENDGTSSSSPSIPTADPTTVANTPATTDQSTQQIDVTTNSGAPSATNETDGSVTTTSTSTTTETSQPYVEINLRRNGDIEITDSNGNTTTIQQDVSTNSRPDGSSTTVDTTTTQRVTGGTTFTTYQGGTPITNTESVPTTSSTGSTVTTSTIGADGTSTTSTSTTGTDAVDQAGQDFPGAPELGGDEFGSIDGLIDGIGNLTVNDSPATAPTHNWTIGGGGNCTSSTYNFVFRGTDMGFDICSSINLVQSALYWFFAMLTAIFVFQTWATANRGA